MHTSVRQQQTASQTRARSRIEASQPAPGTTQQPTVADILRPIPELLTYFIGFAEQQFDTCVSFCNENPSIWAKDFTTLRTLVLDYLRRDDEEAARRVIQRYLMLELSSKAKSFEGKIELLNRRVRRGEDRKNFEDLCQRYLEEARAKVPREARRAQSTTPAAPVRHAAGALRGTKVDDEASTLLTRAGATTPAATLSQALPQRTKIITDTEPGPQIRRSPSSKTQTPPQAKLGQEARPSGQQWRRESMTSDVGSFRGGPAAVGDRPYRPGPNTEYMSGWPKPLARHLHESFKMYSRKENIDKVFHIGSLLAVFWHENYGSHLPPEMQNVPREPALEKLGKGGFVTETDNGELIYSNIRRFIIVNMRDGFSVGVPITTYGDKGVSAKKLSDKERRAHAIVYDSDLTATLQPNEPAFPKDPIAVKMNKGKTLWPSSRLYYAKPSSINHNIKVQHLGNVVRDQIRTLLLNFDEEVSPLRELSPLRVR